MIPDLGNQHRVPSCLESICTTPFQARASDVKLPKLRQQSSNCGMPCFVNVFGNFRGTWDQSDENQGMLFMSRAHMFSNINHCDIQWPGMLIARKPGQVSLVGCTYDWHNRHSGRKLILCIPPHVTHVHHTVTSTTQSVSHAQQFKIEVSLKWEMC